MAKGLGHTSYAFAKERLFSVAPPGLESLTRFTHGLRRGLQSYAGSAACAVARDE